jgi:integrase
MVRRRGKGEGSIGRRTEDGLWYARIDLGSDAAGKRRSRTVYSRTRRGAADKLQALLHDRRQGQPVAADRQTVGAFLDHWLAESVAPSVRPRTHESYAQLIRAYIAPAIGQRPLRALEHAHVQELVTGLLASGKSARTARYTLAVLRRALGRAVLWGRVPRNVALLATPPAAASPERAALTPEQGRALLAIARGQRLEALYRVALTLGLRLGEVLGLRWEDVDLDAGTLRVARTVGRVGGKLAFGEPKTPRSRRTLPLPAALARSLAAHRERQRAERTRAGARWSDWGLVFATRAGTPLEPRNTVRAFKSLLARAGLPDIRFHDLRHACASFLVAAGHHPRVVMEALGHSQIAVTMGTYAHVYAGTLRAVADTMEALLPETPHGDADGVSLYLPMPRSQGQE